MDVRCPNENNRNSQAFPSFHSQHVIKQDCKLPEHGKRIYKLIGYFKMILDSDWLTLPKTT